MAKFEMEEQKVQELNDSARRLLDQLGMSERFVRDAEIAGEREAYSRAYDQSTKIVNQISELVLAHLPFLTQENFEDIQNALTGRNPRRQLA